MGVFKRGEWGLLWPFYLEVGISRIISLVPIFFVVYFLDIGLSAFQIGILLAIMPLFSLVFEIPTGAVADLYGRKFSVLLGHAIEGVGYFLLLFFTNFYLFMLVFALIGIGRTFSSGAKEAWVADLVGKKKLLHAFFTKKQILESAAMLLAGFVGAFVVKVFGLWIIWLLASISFVISILFLLFADERFRKRKVHVKKALQDVKKQTKVSIDYSRKHPVISYFFIATGILLFAELFASPISIIPFMQEFGLAEYQFGYLWSALAVVSIIGTVVGAKYHKKVDAKEFIIISLVLGAGITFFIVFVNSIFTALLVLFGATFFMLMKNPVERVFFHSFIPSKLRATVGSVEAMWLSVVGLLAIPIVGFAVDFIGPRYTIFLAGILMIPGIIEYMRIKEK